MAAIVAFNMEHFQNYFSKYCNWIQNFGLTNPWALDAQGFFIHNRHLRKRSRM